MALSQEQMEAMLAQLAKDNAELKAQLEAAKTKRAAIQPISLKVQDVLTDRMKQAGKTKPSGALSMYGLQRNPVTLYASQWLRVIEFVKSGKLDAFIAENRARLTWRDEEVES